MLAVRLCATLDEDGESMDWFLIALLMLLVTGMASVCMSAFPAIANRLGSWGTGLACLLAAVPVLQVTLGRSTTFKVDAAWNVPLGRFLLEIDSLSAWFMVPVIGIAFLSAAFAGVWIKGIAPSKRRTGLMWLCFDLLVAAMLVVLTARNSLLFLVAWEVMSLSMYFLVVWDDERAEVVATGRLYLIAAHLGTACLLPVLLLIGGGPETLEFTKVTGSRYLLDGLFLLSVVGFGTKAGLIPFHVWMPNTYCAAPAYVPALSSAAMAKVAVYGLFRTQLYLGSPPIWWAMVVIFLGGVSGVMGLLLAQSQRDLRRVLAYSSSENMGIIFIGFGLGMMGMTLQSPAAASLGFAGALLHCWNHSLNKGLLALGTGVISHQTGTTNIDQLGGLMKRLPLFSICMSCGFVAISGLPPLNGFVSEFLILLGAFSEELLGNKLATIAALTAIAALALTAGLAVSCFTQVAGIMLLGAPRSQAAANAEAPPLRLIWPSLFLASLCIAVGFMSGVIVPLTIPVLNVLEASTAGDISHQIRLALQPIEGVNLVMFVLIGVMAGLAGLRSMLLANRDVGRSQTWDCGYAEPTARMQYTASSYTQAQVDFYLPVMPVDTDIQKPIGLFPQPGHFRQSVPDSFLKYGYARLFRLVDELLARLSWLQQGQVNIYVLYIAATLFGLLIWYLRKAI